jgi:uncharacterized membrane protein
LYSQQLCEPPVKKIVFRWGGYQPFDNRIEVESEDGVTLGHMFQVLVDCSKDPRMKKNWSKWIKSRVRYLRGYRQNNPFYDTPQTLIMIEGFAGE